METLIEYANRIGAELKPTCLADMTVMSAKKNSQPDNFFCGDKKIDTWLEVKDPSGGVNKSGKWPFNVLKDSDGMLSIVCCSY
ncbi:MAG: hypothetical protein COA43_14600 [Robiginitomaculum sp.]|nr:MAG: hypothetical protein COA43_14600 [Robiginitomaculum sp.]